MTADPSIIAFQQACGCDGDWFVESTGNDRAVNQHTAFPWPFAVIGREESCDLYLADGDIGRRHAFLQVLDGHAFCFDLGSRTGTHWSNGPRSSGWVKPGAAIHIGPYRLHAHCNRMPSDTTAGFGWDPLQRQPSDLWPLPAVTLEFRNGATSNRRWQIDRAITLVGSAPGCKVRLRSDAVGRFHCYFVATASGVWAVDLLSARGLFRNAEPLRCARLEDGDELVIGGFLIRCHFDAVRTAGHVQQAPATSQSNSAAFGRSHVMPLPVEQAQQASAGSALALRMPVHGDMTQPGDDRILFMMNQFSQMQMQMFDQFQQTMMMMFQMFGSLQQEQVATLRDELARVRELTQELHELKESLAKADPPPAVPAQPTVGYKTPQPAVENPTPDIDVATVIPKTPSVSHGNGDMPTATKQAPEPKAAKAGGAKSTADLHTLLSQRMETIEQERQSRWQKILGLLGSKSQ